MPTSTSSSSASSTSADPSSTSTDLNFTDDSSDNTKGNLNSSNDNDGSGNDDSWDEDDSEKDNSDSDSSNNNEGSNSNNEISNNNDKDANHNGDDDDVSNKDEELKSEFASPNDISSNDEDSNSRKMKAATTPKKQGTTTKNGATVKDALDFKNVSLTGLSGGNHPILRASFTSNKLCGQTISCNAGKNNDHTGVKGVGATAVNKMLFGGPPGVYDGSGGHSNVNGLGGGCGSCWTLTPGFNYYEDNGIPLGKTVVVRINDECTDPGYCDQTPDSPLNTGPTKDIQPSGKFEAPVHFDLCEATGVAAAFFGELKTGVAMGAAQYNPDCTGLEDGEFGAKTVGDLAMPF
ncbi:MAG: hypothetical protein Q9180_003259 [Flavoplaca navasiana]